MDASDKMVADALKGSWVHRLLPNALWPYAQLARWERPIGWRLLMWPCWWSFLLAVNRQAASVHSGLVIEPDYAMALLDMAKLCAAPLLLFMFGAILMRGAGCTYNDLVDQDIDERVARTRSRPLPSGRVTRNQAMLFLALQLLAGLAVLLQFNRATILLGCLSLVTVVIYPFMKRVTWWPQLFLGFAFSWGALVGWPAQTGELDWAAVVLYIGCIFWVIGYDTMYAHQDIEDDALVGVKSTARLFGQNTKRAMGHLYGAALVLFAFAFFLAGDTAVGWIGWPAWLGLGAGAAHMAWQIRTLDIADPARCLKLFKSNSHFGWILFSGLAASAVLTSARNLFHG